MLILDRNWRPHGSEAVGEVDLIARDGDALVIVEVKTRRALAFGAPVEAVTRRKIRQLRSLALALLAGARAAGLPLRFFAKLPITTA